MAAMDATPRDDHPEARSGAGTLRWDAGGWFGALFGGTSWMALAALASAESTLVLTAGLSAFALAWALGLWLWSRRARWSPFAAVELLLAVLALLAAGVLGAADHAGRLEGLAAGWSLSVTPWVVLAIFPGLMALFAWLELRGRRAAG